MKIPFDISERELMITYLSYIDEIFVSNKKEISKPRYFMNDLKELELYYQRINIYYSFGKNFGLEIDIDWIKKERVKIGEKINRLLKNIREEAEDLKS